MRQTHTCRCTIQCGTAMYCRTGGTNSILKATDLCWHRSCCISIPLSLLLMCACVCVDYLKAQSMAADMDIHAVAGLLKKYFRQLPEPLFTDLLYTSFIQGCSESLSPQPVVCQQPVTVLCLHTRASPVNRERHVRASFNAYVMTGLSLTSVLLSEAQLASPESNPC